MRKPKTTSVSFYADLYKLRSCTICTAIVTCLTALLTKQIEQKTGSIDIVPAVIFGVILILIFCVADARCFFVKNTFSEQGIRCTLFGKTITEIKWEQIERIACIVYLEHSNRRAPCIYFSGHELSEKEKKRGVRNAVLKNDVVVLFPLGKLEKTIAKIRAIHEFELAPAEETYRLTMTGFEKVD